MLTRQARQQAQIAAGVAALLVAVVAAWLLLRIVGGGSDVTTAQEQQARHGAATTALAQVSAAIKNPAQVATAGAETISSLTALGDTASKALLAASGPAPARHVSTATRTLTDALARAAVNQPGTGTGNGTSDQLTQQKVVAVQAYATAVSTLTAAERAAATAAGQAAQHAASSRSWSMRWLALLLLLTGAAAVAWFTGLLSPGRGQQPDPRLAGAGYEPAPGSAPPPGPGGYRPPARARIPQTPAGLPVLGATHPVATRVFDQDEPYRPAAPPAEPARLSSSEPARGGWRSAGSRSAGTVRSRLAVTTSAHPGITLDAAAHAGLVIYAGSMIGPEHRGGKNFAPREDAYSWAPGQDSGVIVTAVADGVGSSRNSHAASLLATEVAVAHLRPVTSSDVATWFEHPGLWRDQALQLMSVVAGQLRPEQVDARARMIDLATGSSTSGQRRLDPATTLVVAIGLVSGDGVRVLWASVGDSQVSVLAPGAGQVSWSQAEGDAPSGTLALPRDAARVISSQYFLPPGHAFLLTTDGCEKVLSLDPGAVALLHEMIRTPGDTAHLLDLLQCDPPGAGDDRTLVLFAAGGGR